jgi:hypothetical protein
MTKPTIKLVNATTGEELEREMNAQEFAEYEATQVAQLAKQAEAQAKATQKAALLERLGITEDEAKLLLA